MASMPHGRLGPPLWSFAADAHDCIMVLVRLDRPHTSSWRDAAPGGELPLRSLWLIPPGAPCRGPQTEPDGGKKPEKKRLTEKAPYKLLEGTATPGMRSCARTNHVRASVAHRRELPCGPRRLDNQ